MWRRQVDQRCFGRDRDGFGDRADVQRQVERDSASNGDRDAAPIEAPESRQLRRNPVAPRNNVGGAVAPVRTGYDLAIDTGLFIGDNDGHSWQDGTLCIRDPADDFRGPLLGE